MTQRARAVWAIAQVTWSEILRDRILYNVLLGAVALLFLSLLAAQLMFGRSERILIDFGIASLQISCGAIAVFTGATLLGREFERRTAWIALARPISRHQFVLGKWLGLAVVLALNWALLCAVALVVLGVATSIHDSEFAALVWSPTLLAAAWLAYVQALMLSSFAVLFSSLMSTTLSAVLCVGVYLVGASVGQLELLGQKAESPIARHAMLTLARVLPSFEPFHLGSRVTYALPIEAIYPAVALAYAVAWVALCLLGAGVGIRRREQSGS